MKRICCVLNYPSHYRESIYKKMEGELGCDFYFGDIDKNKIKKINYASFSKKITDLKTKRFLSVFNWISGAVQLSFKKEYQKYILTGDILCFSNWLMLIMNRLQRKKTYLWTHGWYGDEGFTKKIIKKIFFKLSNGLFLYGDYAKQLMIEEGFSENKLHVIYNSLDYENQIKIRRELKMDDICNRQFNEKLPVIIFTGRLIEDKKLDLLIRAHKQLFDLGIKTNIIIIGDGPSRGILENLVKELNIEDFYYFHGECYDETLIGNFFYNSTVCVSPGNIGLTSIHAMTYGCPAISHSKLSSQGPEFEAIIEGQTGGFFKFEDVDSLAEKIHQWITSNSPKLEPIIENCFKIVDDKYNSDYQISVIKRVIS